MACAIPFTRRGNARNPQGSRKLIREKDTASRPNLLALPIHNFSCGVMVLRVLPGWPPGPPARAVRRATCDSCIVDRNLAALLVFVHKYRRVMSAPGDLMKVTTGLLRWAGIGTLALGVAPAVFAQAGAFGGGFGPPLQASQAAARIRDFRGALRLSARAGQRRHEAHAGQRSALGRSLATCRQHPSRDLHRWPGLHRQGPRRAY